MVRGRSLGRAIGVVALVGATFGVSTASAQVDYEIMASLQFNFSNPGARSLAMAGALTGAGDDATGAWTNPGGLTNITRPEVGVEFRGFGFETPFVSSGRFNGAPTNIGIDTVSGLTYGNTDNSTHSLSFVSAVVPKSRFAFAFYRTEVAKKRGTGKGDEERNEDGAHNSAPHRTSKRTRDAERGLVASDETSTGSTLNISSPALGGEESTPV